MVIDEQQWQHFSLDGFLELGRVLTGPEVEALRERADDLATGRVHNEHVLTAVESGDGGAGPGDGTLRYGKVEGVERDDVFRALIASSVFLEVCARIYGPHTPISIFRAMVMNKPAGGGTALEWHQDGGSAWQLDRDPLVTIWVALDDATIANGCLEAVRGSHRNGLLSAEGGTLSKENAEIHCDEDLIAALELTAGHAVLLHSWLIHRSGVNRSAAPRRAFSGSYLDGRTIRVLTGKHLPIVAGTVSDTPYPYVGQLESDRVADAESLRAAEERAARLESEVEALRERCEDAEAHAGSLEAEREHARRRLGGRASHWLRSLRH